MKNLLTIAFMLFIAVAAQAQSMDRPTAERLLRERNLSLRTLESQGFRLVMGENTGGGMPAGRVEVFLLEDRAVLKSEVAGMSFQPRASSQLGHLDSLRVGGIYFTREDVKAYIVRR